MFESELERLEHEIEDALLFYYAAQCPEEKESKILRAVESSLERLQHCRDRIIRSGYFGLDKKEVLGYLPVSRDCLQEGLSVFFESGVSKDVSYWKTLLTLAIPLYDDIERLFGEQVSVEAGCS